MSPRELGARWLAAGGGWRPGMRVLAAESDPGDPPSEATYVVAVDKDGATVAWSEYPGTAEGGLTLSDDVPDVTDPATLGAMLGVLRERYADPLLYAGPWNHGWAMFAENDRLIGVSQCATEAEAMVAAGEAWKRANP